MLQRMLGRGVRDRHLRRAGRPPGRARARGARARATRAATTAPRATTASCAPATSRRSARSGTRFLQLPLGEVEHVDAAPRRRRPHERAHPRALVRPGRRRAAARDDRARLRAHGHRLGADLVRRDARDLHRVGRRSRVPRWLAGSGRGWVTAEYGMLPASTGDRKQRDVTKGRPDGRTVEIQRLIGRSLRGVIDFSALGERTIYVDCDVLQADGGTRCASITGGYVALALACDAPASHEGELARSPLTGSVAAVSCGIVDGAPLLDLDYPEDSTAEVDANVVMTGDGGLVEVQATAERTPLSRAHLDELLALAATGIDELRSRAGARRSRAVAAREARARHPQRAQAARVRARCWRRTSSSRCPTTSSCRPRPATRSRPTRCPRRAPPRGRPAAPRSPTTPASRRPRSAARPACARPASPARTRPTRRTSPSSLREAPPGSAPRLRLRDRATSTRARRGAHLRGPLHRHAWRAEPRGTGGFGYDPVFLPDDRDDGRTMAELTPGREGRHQPPRPRGAGAPSAPAHGPRGMRAGSSDEHPVQDRARPRSRSPPTRR